MDILAEQMENGGEDLSGEKLKSILDKYFEGVPEADKLEGELNKEGGLKLKSKEKYGGQEVNIGDIYDGDLGKELLEANQVDNLLKDNTKVQYVTNYGIDIDGDKDSRDDWEIFYVEDYQGEDSPKQGNQPATGKRIFLIASDYVRADTPELKTAVKSDDSSPIMESGTDRLEHFIKYWSSFPTYHCTLPNEEGPNREKACAFPKLFEFSNYDIKNGATTSGNPNSKCASSLLCTENWSSFANNWADYATGGPSVEMWIDSWNKRHGSENKLYYSDKEQNSNTTGYYVGTNEKPNSTSVNVSNSDPLYFPHKTSTFTINQKDEFCSGYWLASPSASHYYRVMKIDCNGNVSFDAYNGAAQGMRPIVCLKSDVKLVRSSEILDGKGNAECFKLVKN